jgi:hypothetical protein
MPLQYLDHGLSVYRTNLQSERDSTVTCLMVKQMYDFYRCSVSKNAQRMSHKWYMPMHICCL